MRSRRHVVGSGSPGGMITTAQRSSAPARLISSSKTSCTALEHRVPMSRTLRISFTRCLRVGEAVASDPEKPYHCRRQELRSPAAASATRISDGLSG